MFSQKDYEILVSQPLLVKSLRRIARVVLVCFVLVADRAVWSLLPPAAKGSTYLDWAR